MGFSWDKGMVLPGAIKAPLLIRFFQRLILNLDNLPVHRAKSVRAWLAAHPAEIEVFRLSSYSPELNPDECLNADLKQAVTRQAPARIKAQLKRAAISHMRRLSKSPARIGSFFHHKPVRYAA
jgi:transposase